MILESALISGWRKAIAQLGPEPTAWQWGTLHQVRIQHPLSAIPAIAKAFPALEGGASGGDSYSVQARWLGNGPGWQVTGGASYLQVIDVGAWDNSLMLNLPGQSNDPRSRHHADQYGLWSAGHMQQMPFSRAAVDARATRRTILTPSTR
jgi:penicillin amidase